MDLVERLLATDPEEAIAALHEQVEISRGCRLYLLGYFRAARKEYTDAINHFTIAEHQAPELKPLIQQSLSQCYSKLERWEEALKPLERLLQEDPECGSAYTMQGEIYAQLKLFANAITAYETALKINLSDAEAWNGLGGVYGALCNIAMALHCFQRAIEHCPTFINAWNNKGKVLELLGEHDEAKACYAQAEALSQ